MKNLTVVTALLILPLMLATLGVDSTTGVAFAAERSAKSKQKTRKVPAMREKTYKTLSQAQLFIEEETPLEAVPILEKMLKRRGLNRYEVAQIWSLLAYAYYSLDETMKTIQAYEQVLAQGKEGIPLALEMSSLRAIFQLYYGEEEYSKALTYIDRWLALKDLLDPATIFLKANCYYQLDDYHNSLKYAIESEQVAIAQAKVVKEQWLYLQVVNYSEIEDYRNVVGVLEKLIVAYPKKLYWIHLAGMYAELEEEDRALGAYYSAYKQDMLTKESELVTLAQRLLIAEVPFEAAEMLEKGIEDGVVEENEKNLRLLGQAWTMAQEMEKAIETWRQATKEAEDGEMFYRLAQVLAQEDKHSDAVKAYRNALDNGDLKKPYDVSLYLGISLMELRRWDQAVDAFRDASKDKKRAKQVRNYIRYVRGEKRRLEALRKMDLQS